MRAVLLAGLALPLPAAAQAAPRGFVQINGFGMPDRPGVLRAAERTTQTQAGPADAYPTAALAAGSEGQVMTVVTVGPDDRVGACRVEGGRRVVSTAATPGSFGPRLTPSSDPLDPRLGAAACALLRRPGMFRHALADDGSPIAGEVRTEVTFVRSDPGGSTLVSLPPAPMASISRAKPRDPAPRRLAGVGAAARERNPTVVVAVDAKGRPGRCTIGWSSGDDATDVKLCAGSGEWRFTPAVGFDGKKREGRAVVKYELLP